MKQITNKRINEFKVFLANEEKSCATIEKYTRDVCAFFKWLGKENLCKATVLNYKSYLIEHYKPASVNSILSSLNSFFDYNKWYECKVKSLKIQKQIFASKDRELSREEYERLIMTAKSIKNERLCMLMQTICASGIRVSELQFITKESVYAGKEVINCKGKFRIILLPEKLCKMLAKYIKKNHILSGPVFVSKSGKPLDRSNIWSDMKKLCELAGVSKKKVFPHNLRHLFARTFYSLQKDIVRLADILGHSSINTTRNYTMETVEIHRKQIEQLNFVYMRA
ncbi:MAG: tyrosine-type recombinase/integrase [Clostridia bacterium]|nr:tyrosine-type recombinase/integrase [Clostridia bacterium]